MSQQEQIRQEEARQIVEEIGDPRLRADHHLEYFTIHTSERVRHILKRRVHEDPEKINGFIIKDLKRELALLDEGEKGLDKKVK